MSGQVFEVNDALTSKPSLINKSAEGDGSIPMQTIANYFIGWICRITVAEKDAEMGRLLTEEQYSDFLAAQHEGDAASEEDTSMKK